MIKINKRLNEIANLVQGEVIADIGSDHALLPIWLYSNKKIKKAYASDMSKNCVEKIKINIKKYNIPEDIIIPVLSDGLNFDHSGLTDVIIAGMGGETIAKIIKPLKNINFILQPNSKIKFLQKYLYENDFETIKEITIEDKKRFYNIINAKVKSELK